MRYIRNISDDQNKAGDTDNIFRFNLLQGEDIFNFGDYPISINIANSSGYILSMVPEKEFGNSVIKLDFNDQSLKSLTPDNYLLEVEVKFPDGTTATFPTKGGMPFSVNSNLKNTAGQLVPTVTFDEVLNAVDEKVNNYLATVAKGDKGDPGLVGPIGEVDTSKDYTFTGNDKFTQPIDARIKERGILTGTVDVLTMVKSAAANSGIWKLSGVTIVGSGQVANDTVWGTLEINPYADGSGAGVIIHAVSGFPGGTSQLISSGDSSSTMLTWHKLADDSTVVHNTGNETAAGDKTFTGVITATQLIDGALKTREATFTDFATVAANMDTYAGIWFVVGKTILNSPVSDVMYGVIEVIPAFSNNTGVIRYNDIPNWRHGVYVTTVDNTGINGWEQTPDNSKLVHNTGTETVAGDKTFTGNNTFTGQTSFWFKQIQWTSGIMQGTFNIQRIGNWVNVKFDMSANTGTGTTTLSLPVGYRPLSTFVRELEQGAAGISQNGTFYIPTSYTGTNAMTFSYPTNDAWPMA